MISDKAMTTDLVQSYQCTDPTEIEIQQEILDLLKQADDPFQRSCWPAHITASAFVLNVQGTHVCLMHHRKFNCWTQLGGHADGHHDLWYVAQKEVQEEAGLSELRLLGAGLFDCEKYHVPSIGTERAHIHYDVRFLCQCTTQQSLQRNHESKALQWVDIKNPEVKLDQSWSRVWLKLRQATC